MSDLAELLIATADSVFGAADGAATGFDPAAWARIADSGLDRLLIPEAEGGAGDAFVEAVEVARRFGANPCAVPFVETLVANRCLAETGHDVPPGPKTLAMAVNGAIIPWGSAPVAIVAADGSAFPADRAVRGVERTNLAEQPLLLLDQAIEGPDAAPALALYATLTAAAIAGALEAATELTISFVGERVQFGRRIGAFQAVQHIVARMAEESAAATAAAQLAGRRQGGNAALYAAAIAKSRASEAAGLVAAMAHQCHGAIGFTREYRLWRHTARALAWRDEAGSESWWNERIGRAMLAEGAGALWPLLVDGVKL